MGDFNVDNVHDIFMSGLPGALTGTLDQNVLDHVIFASPETGARPIKAVAMTLGRRNFFSQAYEWSIDHDYFDDNAPELPAAIWIDTAVYMAEYCARPEHAASLPGSPPIAPRVGNTLEEILAATERWVEETCRANGLTVIHYDFVRVIYTIPIGGKDYRGFHRGALAFARIVTTVNAGSNGGLIAQSDEAIALEQLFKWIWGLADFMGGVLSEGGTVQGETNIPAEQRPGSRARMVDSVILHTDFLNALVDARKAERDRARERLRQACYNRAWGLSPITMQEHYNRNQYQDNSWMLLTDLPTSLFRNEGETPTHNIRASGNDDWRGRIGTTYQGWQLVYDSNGARVDDPINLGTYDFAPPRLQFFRHIEQDITPWIEWKNSTQDSSTRLERLTALYRSKRWAISVPLYWKDLYGCLNSPETFE